MGIQVSRGRLWSRAGSENLIPETPTNSDLEEKHETPKAMSGLDPLVPSV